MAVDRELLKEVTQELRNTVKKLRRHGKGKDYEMLGYNSRMYVLNSMIIQLRLKNLNKDRKTKNAR